jgi:hypothetical protein
MSWWNSTIFSSVPPIGDRFVSLNVGNTLILKVCGFIDDHQARILDVSETQLNVRIGAAWYRRVFNPGLPRLIDVNLKIERDAESRLAAVRQLSASSYCTLSVQLRPVGPGWNPMRFQQTARRLLWTLRAHFMAYEAGSTC